MTNVFGWMEEWDLRKTRYHTRGMGDSDLGGFSLINVNVTEIIRQMDEPYNPDHEEKNQSALVSGLIKMNKLINQECFYGVALIKKERKNI